MDTFDNDLGVSITFGDGAWDGFLNIVTSFKESYVGLVMEDGTHIEGTVKNVSLQGGTIDIGPFTISLDRVKRVHYF